MKNSNCFTVDLEDWYQGIEKPFESWSEFENRVEIGLNIVLNLLDKYKVKATFFTLGWIAEKYPKLVKRIAMLGHELASHGYSHEKVYDLSAQAFREEIRKTKFLIEDLSGQHVVAYRAPFFSITSKSLWALDILAEEGYQIDCSISPVKTWRYGIENCPNKIFKFKENGLIEFPVSTFKMLTKKWAIGGAYFRLFPSSLSNYFFKQRQKRNENTMFYIHPWGYDAKHPVVEMERKAKFTHYVNLHKTAINTENMLQKFDFITVGDAVSKMSNLEEISYTSFEK